jgi:hypothetical protein
MPLLAQAIVSKTRDGEGATRGRRRSELVLPTPVPKEFVQAVGSTYLRSYVGGDQGNHAVDAGSRS